MRRTGEGWDPPFFCLMFASSQFHGQIRQNRACSLCFDAADEETSSPKNLGNHHLALADADRPQRAVRVALDRRQNQSGSACIQHVSSVIAARRVAGTHDRNRLTLLSTMGVNAAEASASTARSRTVCRWESRSPATDQPRDCEPLDPLFRRELRVTIACA